MGSNWFNKVKLSQAAPLDGYENVVDDEIKKGPKPAKSKYERGMIVRDRRRSSSQNQVMGKVDQVYNNKVKIVWNYKSKADSVEEIFDVVEDTEILSMLVGEV